MKTYQNHAMTDAEARQALVDACRQVAPQKSISRM